MDKVELRDTIIVIEGPRYRVAGEDYKMSRERRVKNCQRILDNGIPCSNKHSGRGPRKYCSVECRKAARQQHQQLTNAANYAALQDPKNKTSLEHHQKVNRCYRYICYHHHTKDELEPLVARAEVLRKQDAGSKDDFHENVVRRLNEIRNDLLSPRIGLPRVVVTSRAEAETLYHDLMQKQQDARNDPVLNRHLLCVQALHRDMGRLVSSAAFTIMRREAKTVQELACQQGELLSLIQALFVGVERYRLQFLLDTTQTQLLTHAHTRLDCAEYLCEWAISRFTGEQKRTANLLSYYVPLFEATLALDADAYSKAADWVQPLTKRAKVVAQAAGTGPMTDTVRFLCEVNQAEIHLRRSKIACAFEHFKKAEQIFSTMQSPTLESQLYVAYLKAGLSLARNRPSRHENVHKYIMQFQRHPFLTHYKHLEELKRRYKKDVDESLFKGRRIYIDTVFRHLYLFLLTLDGAESCS
jgi:hypothetical protein